MEKMNQTWEKMKMLVGMEVEEEDEEVAAPEESFMDDFNRQCTLSTKQLGILIGAGWLEQPLLPSTALSPFEKQKRLYGFATCLVAGLACTLLSMIVFFNPIKFGITFTFGNLLALGSTAFLIGPKRQVTMMLDPVRIYATAIYIASIIVALFCALYVHNKILTFLAIMLQFGALVWYSLSYIPFARSMVSKVMVALFDTEF